MLLGSAVQNVSLSLRLFPQAPPRFSLRQRGCPGKEDFAPCGVLHHAVETSSGTHQQYPTNPTLISKRMLCFPRGDAKAKRPSLYAGFSRRATNTRLCQAATAAHRTDSDFPATAMLSQRFSAWHERHFAAASSERLWVFTLSRQGRRAAGELVSLGTCFPGLQVHARGSPCNAELS